jgi:hypothetical protein
MGLKRILVPQIAGSTNTLSHTIGIPKKVTHTLITKEVHNLILASLFIGLIAAPHAINQSITWGAALYATILPSLAQRHHPCLDRLPQPKEVRHPCLTSGV